VGLFYNDTRVGPRNPHGAREEDDDEEGDEVEEEQEKKRTASTMYDIMTNFKRALDD